MKETELTNLLIAINDYSTSDFLNVMECNNRINAINDNDLSNVFKVDFDSNLKIKIYYYVNFQGLLVSRFYDVIINSEVVKFNSIDWLHNEMLLECINNVFCNINKELKK